MDHSAMAICKCVNVVYLYIYTRPRGTKENLEKDCGKKTVTCVD